MLMGVWGTGGTWGGARGGGGTGGERCIKQVIDAGGWSAATYQAAITNCQCNLSGYNILFYVQFFFADGCLVRRGGGGRGGRGGRKGRVHGGKEGGCIKQAIDAGGWHEPFGLAVRR